MVNEQQNRGYTIQNNESVGDGKGKLKQPDILFPRGTSIATTFWAYLDFLYSKIVLREALLS